MTVNSAKRSCHCEKSLRTWNCDRKFIKNLLPEKRKEVRNSSDKAVDQIGSLGKATNHANHTTQTIIFSDKDFFSKCKQIHRKVHNFIY